MALVSGFGKERWLTLDRHAITAPRNNFGGEDVRIPYVLIDDLRLTRVKSQRFLKIVSRDGRKLQINASMLPSDADFDTVLNILAQRSRSPA